LKLNLFSGFCYQILIISTLETRNSKPETRNPKPKNQKLLYLYYIYWFLLFFYCFVYFLHVNMSNAKQNHRWIRKNIQNSFSQKKNIIIRKINILINIDNYIDTYFVLQKYNKLYYYTLSEKNSWPLIKI
jgi:hypothetical protein